MRMYTLSSLYCCNTHGPEDSWVLRKRWPRVSGMWKNIPQGPLCLMRIPNTRIEELLEHNLGDIKARFRMFHTKFRHSREWVTPLWRFACGIHNLIVEWESDSAAFPTAWTSQVPHLPRPNRYPKVNNLCYDVYVLYTELIFPPLATTDTSTDWRATETGRLHPCLASSASSLSSTQCGKTASAWQSWRRKPSTLLNFTSTSHKKEKGTTQKVPKEGSWWLTSPSLLWTCWQPKPFTCIYFHFYPPNFLCSLPVYRISIP